MLESLIQNLSVRIRASVLLSICKESHHVFLSNDRAEAWGILLGRNVCSFRVINSIRNLRFGKDYYHNNIWNYDEYNMKGRNMKNSLEHIIVILTEGSILISRPT